MFLKALLGYFKQQLPPAEGVWGKMILPGQLTRFFVPWVSVALFPDTWEKSGLFFSLKGKKRHHFTDLPNLVLSQELSPGDA